MLSVWQRQIEKGREIRDVVPKNPSDESKWDTQITRAVIRMFIRVIWILTVEMEPNLPNDSIKISWLVHR